MGGAHPADPTPGIGPKAEPEPPLPEPLAPDAPAPVRLPADPVAYDSPRASLARERGLSAPYIAGGRDPDPDAGQRQERFYGRLLAIMVVILVLAGFVLGILDNLLTTSGGG